jgi:hypothetical protein
MTNSSLTPWVEARAIIVNRTAVPFKAHRPLFVPSALIEPDVPIVSGAAYHGREHSTASPPLVIMDRTGMLAGQREQLLLVIETSLCFKERH